MEALIGIFHEIWNNIVNLNLNMKISDIIDILIVAFLIYKIIEFIRRTGLVRVAWGILLVFIAVWLSGVLQLNILNYLLSTALEVGFLALVVLFQPEIRKLLERVGRSSFWPIFSRPVNAQAIQATITQTTTASTQMAKSRTGALIVFEREVDLTDVINSGTLLDAAVSAELLKNIFFGKAPLHDGAVIIRNGRISAAGCVLPLSDNPNLSRDLGMRHRAGIGISEQSDALVVVVSEETGTVSVAVDGLLKRNLREDTFEELLQRELIVEDDRKKMKFQVKFKVKKNDKGSGK